MEFIYGGNDEYIITVADLEPIMGGSPDVVWGAHQAVENLADLIDNNKTSQDLINDYIVNIDFATNMNKMLDNIIL